jgi:methyltransferase family protein
MNRVDRLLQRWRIGQVIPWIRDGARVLDVGCFDAALFAELGPRLALGIGLDPLLRQAVTGERFRLLPGHFPHTRLEQGPFDVITMLAVLEHVSPAELERWTSACTELLVPGGLVVVTVPSPAVDHILHVLMRLRVLDGMSVEEHHGFEPELIPEVFGRAGFTLTHRARFQLGLNNLFVFAKPAPVESSAVLDRS